MEEHKEDLAVDQRYTAESTAKMAASSEGQTLGSGKKQLEPVLPCMTRVVLGGGEERFICKVFYDEHSSKSIIITASTTAKAVCAIGAQKLKLSRFYFSLFAQKGDELHVLADDQLVSEVLTQWKAEGATEAKLLFLRPPPKVNLKMREHVFKGWLNFILRKRSIVVEDLRSGLADGLVLVALVEEITGRKNLPHNKEPQSKEDGRANIEAAIELFKSFGISIPGDPTEGIVAGDILTILGTLWSVLFRHCTVNNCLGFNEQQEWSHSNASEFVFCEGFLGWCNQQMAKDYSALAINDFGPSWCDGLAICALMEMADGYAVHFRKVWGIDERDRLEYVLAKAHDHFRIPPLLTIEDWMDREKLDEVSVIVYLVVLATCLRELKQQKASRSSKVSLGSAAAGKGTPTRLYFEGLPDVQNKIFMLQPNIVAGELRQLVGQKMRIDPNGFWIYIIASSGAERVPAEDEPVLESDSTVVLRMVAGSNYYEQDLPSSSDATAASQPGPTRATAKKSKKKRMSFFGGKKKP